MSIFKGKHESVYARLIAKGYTREDILAAHSDGYHESHLRSAHLAVIEPEGQDPIVGVRYTGDYRAEEEYGSAGITETLPDNQDSVAIEETPLGLLFTVINRGEHYGLYRGDYGDEQFARQREKALEFAEREINYRLGADGEGRYTVKYEGLRLNKSLSRFTVPELKAAARHEGIEGTLPRRKDDLLALVRENRQKAEKNHVVPGNFHSGSVLGIVAPAGIVADTLRMLYEAAQAKSLTMGGIANPFARGMVFFDDRDKGKALVKSIRDTQRQYDRWMKDVAPVEKSFKGANGYLYAISQPQEREGQVVYWLNYAPRDHKQIFGYFTIAELAQIAAGDYSPTEDA